jgi:thiamine biosynthesis protein ThiS
MHVTVNGEARALSAGDTIQSLLTALGIQPDHVAVELNREIVPQESFADAHLSAGDTIELVRFMAGG